MNESEGVLRDSGATITGARSGSRRMVMRILVVDDSLAVRQYMTAKLRQLAGDSFDVDIDQAASGEEAIAKVEAAPYDLVFLDVVMPGIGGHEACRRIKAIRKTRVAMLSSLKSQDDHKEGHVAGCDNLILPSCWPACRSLRHGISRYWRAIIRRRRWQRPSRGFTRTWRSTAACRRASWPCISGAMACIG
ncbi:MAG: response regulator [Moraxellaceae bacterium]